MTATRTPGISVLTDGRRFIDKRYLGVRCRVAGRPPSKSFREWWRISLISSNRWRSS